MFLAAKSILRRFVEDVSLSNYKVCISVFCASYLASTVVSLCPQSPIQHKLETVYKPIYDFCGFTQSWNLFGPELRQINFHGTAVITYADGTSEFWEVPRMNKLSYWERFRREKWRKWGDDTMLWPNYSALWPDLARFIAREHNEDNENPPCQISLSLHWIEIPPPVCPRNSLPEHTKFHTFFVYQVEREDLSQ